LPTVAGINALYGSSPTNVWAVGAQNTLLHYDGSAWSSPPEGVTQQPTPSFNGIWAASPNDAWVVGRQNISHWDGHAFTVVVPSLPKPLWAIHGAAANDIWSVGGTLVMHYDGQAWTEHSEGLGGGALAEIWAAGNGEAFGSNAGRDVFHYVPGAGWSPAYTLPSGSYPDGPDGIWGSGPNDVWFGGGNGLAHWNGTTWGAPPGTNAPTHASIIWGSGPNDVYVNWSNTVNHFDGTSWKPIGELASRYLHSVSMSGPNDIWVLDYYALAYALCRANHWDGVSWSSVEVPLVSCGNVATAGPHLVWVVGGNDQLIRLQH
jgi:hypothetical protein